MSKSSRYYFFVLLCNIFSFNYSYAQCYNVNISVSSSNLTTVQLFSPAFFNMEYGQFNIYNWTVRDMNGNIIHQVTIPHTNFNSQFMQFTHAIPINETMEVTLEVENTFTGEICTIIDTLEWVVGSSSWQFIFNNGGTTNNPFPQAFFGYNVIEGCTPGVVQFNDQSNGANSWLWTFPGGTPSTSTEQNPVVVYNDPGIYSVSLRVVHIFADNTLEQLDIFQISIPSLSEFSHVSNGLTVSFSPIDFDQDQYLWDFGDGNTSNLISPSHVYEVEGIYDVTLTTNTLCDGSSTTMQVVVGAIPVASFTADTMIGCTPLTVSFQNTSSPNTTVYNWVFPGGIPSTSSLPNPIVQYDTSGVYDVTLIAGNSVGMDTLIISSFIDVMSTPSVSHQDSTVGNIILLWNTSPFIDSTTWVVGLDTLIGDTLQYTALQNGDYIIQQTNYNRCGSNTRIVDTITINVYPSGSIESDQSLAICIGDTVSFIALGTNVDTFSWILSGAVPAIGIGQQFNAVYDSVGSYDVMLIVSNAYGSDSLTRLSYVNVVDIPRGGFSSSVNGLMVSFIENIEGASSYLWDFGDGATSTELNPTHVYNDFGSYNVKLIVSNTCGSYELSQIVHVVNNLPLAAYIISNNKICEEEQVTFVDVSTNQPISRQWFFEGGFPEMSTDSTVIVQYNVSGYYGLELISTNQWGMGSIVVDTAIIVQNKPKPNFDFSIQNDVVNFIYTGNDVEDYEWDFGDGTMSNGISPSHTYTVSGMYEVKLKVMNACGIDSISKIVDFISSAHDFDPVLLLYPNPVRSILYIHNTEIHQKIEEINVYNQWGEKLFQSDIKSDNEIWINMDKYATGLYIVELKYHDKHLIKRKVMKL